MSDLKFPLKYVTHSWAKATIYDADDTPLLHADTEDWGVNEENQNELSRKQELMLMEVVACVNACTGGNPEAIPDMVEALEAIERTALDSFSMKMMAGSALAKWREAGEK